jgi:hypothetical protein
VDAAGASARTPPLNRSIAPYYGKIAVFAWFNAGVRMWDIRDPFAVHEVAYFVPPANKFTVPTCANAETREGGEFGTETATSKCKSAGVTNNVEIDDRGLIYGADRAGSGLHILRLTGYAKEDRHAVVRNTLVFAGDQDGQL